MKPEAELLLAYDDPLGVTAAFNRNLLVRINRELGGDFDVDAFAHRAMWNAAESRVEMHLVSRGAQRVRVPARVDSRSTSRPARRSGPRAPTNTSRATLPRCSRVRRFRRSTQWIDDDERVSR